MAHKTRAEFEAVLQRWSISGEVALVQRILGEGPFVAATVVRRATLGQAGIVGATVAREALEVGGSLSGYVHGGEIHLHVMITRAFDEHDAPDVAGVPV
jgi:hypothetical protein